MRSRVAWLLGLAGLVALFRRRRASAVAVEPFTESPADELRRKLDEVRGEDEAEQAPAAGLDVRRQKVHDAGRAAVDEMRRPTSAE